MSGIGEAGRIPDLLGQGLVAAVVFGVKKKVDIFLVYLPG